MPQVHRGIFVRCLDTLIDFPCTTNNAHDIYSSRNSYELLTRFICQCSSKFMRNSLLSISHNQTITQIVRPLWRRDILLAFSVGTSCGIGLTFLTRWLLTSKRKRIMQQQQTANQSWLWYLVGFPWRVIGMYVCTCLTSCVHLLTSVVGSGSIFPFFGYTTPVSFPTEFESRYGNVHPNWSSSSFQQLASQAKTQFKFIFVYLHSSLNENSDQFCRYDQMHRVGTQHVTFNSTIATLRCPILISRFTISEKFCVVK